MRQVFTIRQRFWMRQVFTIRQRVLMRQVFTIPQRFCLCDLQDGNKNYFFPTFFAHYFLKVHSHHFSKIKSHKEVTKQEAELKFFFPFLLDNIQPDPDSYLWLADLDPYPGGPKTYWSYGSGSPTLLWTLSEVVQCPKYPASSHEHHAYWRRETPLDQ